MISDSDKSVLRRLAEEQAEIAALPVHQEKIDLWKRLNSLEPVRPMVSIFQIPWNEMDPDGELRLETSDPICRKIETSLRQTLYEWRHLPVDMVVEDCIWCPIVVGSTGFGIAEESEKLYASPGSVASRRFVPQIREEADIEKIQMPQVSVDWDKTEQRAGELAEIFGPVLPVRTRGVQGSNFAPWDLLVRWWGVEEAMLDLVLRPELVHAAMERLTAAHMHMLDQWEALGVLALNNGNNHTGGGLCYTDELPSPGCDPAKPRAKDLWGRAMAQIFSAVSPAMHEEFALRYERRWLERFGLCYYGCCEPLDGKIGIIRSIANLRKVSISPWADAALAAEQIAGDYVISLKPNPSHVAVDKWDPDLVRRELRGLLEQTRGCAAELILKDISTVRYEPRRLWEWAQVAMEVVDEFA